MRRLALVFFLLGTGSALAEPSLTISCEAPLFAKDSSHQRLVAAFGKENVALVSERVHADEPKEVRSVIYPKDPRRKLTVVWDEGAGSTRPSMLLIEKPSQWTAPNGARAGMSLEDLEKLNGAPFRVPGFSSFLRGDLEWSKAMHFHPGGCFTNGELEPTAKLPKPQMDKLSGNDKFLSNDPLMRQAQPVVSKLQVFFQVGR